ncbi:MAG TPA: hypothetical protein VMU94_23330 [Streptosporangiaceae bacterium]|nr:hypothetical protein [Streptosporangiaceae bacterium]
MPVAPLSDDDGAGIGAAYNLHLTRQDITSFRALAEAMLTSCDEVERRFAASLPVPPSRSWQRPSPAENPLGAWYVTTQIRTRDDGPLAAGASRSRTTSRRPVSR